MAIINRRSFFRQSSALLAAAQAGSTSTAWAASSIPAGLGLFAVEDEWNKDPKGTLQALGKMGYKTVEFWAPYLEWTPQHAKDIRKIMDDSGMHAYSTHNDGASFTATAVSYTHLTLPTNREV